MSRKLTVALLVLCFSLPAFGQNLGEQSSAGFTNARTYANVDLATLRPPLRLFETVDLTGMTDANSIAVFENQFLVGQPGSPVTYKMFARNGSEVWTQTVSGTGANFRYVPAFSNSLVILGGEGTTSVKAVSVVDGSVLWGKSVGNTTGRFPAVTDNYAIYAGADRIQAATHATGTVLWQQAVTTAAAAIAVRDDSLYFLTHSRTLTAIDVWTGTEKWAPLANVAGDGASLIATEKYVFVNDPSAGIIGAFNAATGGLEWVNDTLSGSFATAPAMALANGRLYVFRTDDGTGDAAVTAYDANTGEEVWAITEPGAGLSDAFVANDSIYYYHAADQVRVRDAATGALLWSIAKPDVKGLSAANGELYVLLDDEIEVYVPVNEIFMPQMASGGGQTTMVMLSNPNPSPVDATVHFYDEDGASVPVVLTGYGARSEVDVTVPANSSLALQTEDQGGESVIVGWVRVVSAGPLRGTTNFQFTEDDEIVREAGVADAVPTGDANVFISVGDNFNAGVAIANPTEQATDVALRLLNSAGEELAARTVSLDSGGHLAQFVNELFEDEVGTAFEGTLMVQSYVPVVVTAIRTKGGIQISSYPVGQAVR